MRKLVYALLCMSLASCGGGNSSGGDGNNPKSIEPNQTSELTTGGTVTYLTTPSTISPSQPINTSITINGTNGTQYTVSYGVNQANTAKLQNLKASNQPTVTTSPEPCIINGSGSCSVSISTGSAYNGIYSLVANVYVNGTLVSNNEPLQITVTGKTPEPQPTPNNNWISTGLKDFITNNNLSNYTFRPNQNLQNNGYMYYHGTNGNNNVILEYDLNKNSWTNITLNLNQLTNNMGYYLFVVNNQLIAQTTNSLFMFSNNTWSLIGSVANGYTITNYTTAGNRYTWHNNNHLGFLASDSNNNYKVYILSNNQLIDKTPTPIHSTEYLSGIVLSGTTPIEWLVTNGYGVYYMNSIDPIVIDTDDYNGSGVYSFANNKFIIQLDNQYLCTASGCHIITGQGFDLNQARMPAIFSSMTLSNGNIQYSPDYISFMLNDSLGILTNYTCKISDEGVLSNCSMVGNSITPILPQPQGYHDEALQMFYSTINGVGIAIGERSTGSSDSGRDSNLYGYYQFNGQQWVDTAPNYFDLVSLNNFSIYGLCPYNTNTPLILTNYDHYSSSPKTGNSYISYHGQWVDISSPNGDTVQPIISNTITTGKYIDNQIYGFYAESFVNYNVEEVFVNNYQYSCSQQF